VPKWPSHWTNSDPLGPTLTRRSPAVRRISCGLPQMHTEELVLCELFQRGVPPMGSFRTKVARAIKIGLISFLYW
jgi:hypothetical protein